jgi:nucleoside-diphosphate-sugar epimerase
LVCEQLAGEINRMLGRNAITCVRLSSIYGPGAEMASRGVNIPAVSAARGLTGTVSFTPSARACIGHVDDVAVALARLLQEPEPAHGLYEGGGLDVSFEDIASAVLALVPEAETTFGDEDQQQLPHLVDWSRLRNEFGVVHRELAAGMESIIEYERALLTQNGQETAAR